MNRVAPGGVRAPAAELRVTRVLTAVVAVTSLLTLAFGASSDWRAAPFSPSFPAGQLVATVPPVAAALAAPWCTLSTLRRLAGWTAAAALAVLVVAFAANLLVASGDRAFPWAATVYAPTVVAALLAWGGRRASWLLLGFVVGVQLLRAQTGGITVVTAVNDLQSVLSAVVLCTLAWVLLHATRDADRVATAARLRAERRSAEQARDEARERAAAIVHDEVLATLLLAATARGAAWHAPVRRHADRALRMVRALVGEDDPLPADAADLVAGVRTVAGDATIAVAGDGRTAVPRDVADALVGALRQAVANSVAHAGPRARRTVHVAAAGDGVRIVLDDDGSGFDPAAIAPERMGIAVSIVGRMRSLPGGDAVVDAAAGRGTTVTLRWAPPRDATDGGSADPLRWLRPVGGGGVTGWRWWSVPLVFAVVQGTLAALAIAGDPSAAGRLAAPLVGLLVALALVWTPGIARPSGARSLVAVAVLVMTSATAWFAASSRAVAYVDLWFLPGAALVLVALAVGGRPGLAMAAGGASGAVVGGGLLVAGIEMTDTSAVLLRAMTNVLVGASLVVAIRRSTAATERLETADVAELAARARRAARQAELAARVAELDALIGPTLERIAREPVLTDDERRACRALEGRLRDQHRGGRLARPPLVDAAFAARARGVDVSLLDDGPPRIAASILDRIARWIADELDEAAQGTVTARILPAGRSELASVVVDGRTVRVLAPGGDSDAGPLRRDAVPGPVTQPISTGSVGSAVHSVSDPS